MRKTISHIFASQFPQFKVYNGSEKDSRFVASCFLPADAAMIAACFGEGSTVRYGHGLKYILWTVTGDRDSDLDYDLADAKMYDRLRVMANDATGKYGPGGTV
jgi:hypothetical protein